MVTSDPYTHTTAPFTMEEFGMAMQGNFTNDTASYEENGIIDMLHIYLIPIVAPIGIAGNLISILIFSLTYLNRQASSAYLAFLAFADSLFLLCLFVGWFGYLGLHLFHRNGWCQIMVYMSYVSAFLSVWTVVSFTVERYIVVFHPLHRHTYCTRKRSIVVISCVAAFALILYSFTLWTTRVIKDSHFNMHSCRVHPDYYYTVYVLTNVDTIITLIIPSVVIIVLNTAIAYKVRVYATAVNQEERNVLTDVEGDTHKSSNIRLHRVSTSTVSKMPRRNRSSLRMRAQMRTTQTLLAISTIFVLLNLPSHAFRIYAFFCSLGSKQVTFSRTTEQVQAFMQLLYYLNFSLNFFLYSAWSGNFRRALAQSFRKMRSKIACPQPLNGCRAMHAFNRGTKSSKCGTTGSKTKGQVTKVQFKVILA